jgi:hypothetical protein
MIKTVFNDRVYDGTNKAILQSGTLGGAVTGENVKVVWKSLDFDDEHVGNRKQVTAVGWVIQGSDGANYDFDPMVGVGSILYRKLHYQLRTPFPRTYDGTDRVTFVGGTLRGALASDEVTVQPGTLEFSNARVGTNKPIYGYGFQLKGNNATDYLLSTDSIEGFGTIVKRPLKIIVHDTVKHANQIDPKYRLEYIGFAEGDDENDLYNLQIARDPGDTVGSYDVWIEAVGAENYEVSSEKGILKILKPSAIVHHSVPVTKLRLQKTEQGVRILGQGSAKLVDLFGRTYFHGHVEGSIDLSVPLQEYRLVE